MYIIPTSSPLSPPPLLESWPPFPSGGASGKNGTLGDSPDGELPSNWSSLIGIVTAIIGNVLIALALNVQRYAHTQLHKKQQRDRERARQALKDAEGNNHRDRRPSGSGGVATAVGNGGGGHGSMDGSRRDVGNNTGYDDGDANDASESEPLTARLRRGDSGWSGSAMDRNSAASPDHDDPDLASSTSYLRSPYWWLGQVLITIGEMGNFLAYGFAPASIVSPLGVVALISNCVIAPILFKEPFRIRDFGGVIVAIAGAVTVVLSAKQEETKLNPHDVLEAITTTAFEIYMGVTFGLIALLMWASPRYGNRTILIDLGLVGLFGGYTVLATKGVSSMLSSTLFGAFITPMTYVLLIILLGTAVMQVRYVNKALQRFDSTQVIPIQFVMFTLSVIIGSAVLYRDFERTTAEQAAKFVGGCLLTFFGVFIITSGRPQADDEDEDGDDLSVAGGRGEYINLSTQGQNQGGADEASTPQTPSGRSTMTIRNGGGSSRRSSRASRVNFIGTVTNRPLSLATETGVPSQRTPVATPSIAASSVPRIPNPASSAAGDYLTYKNNNGSIHDGEDNFYDDDDNESAYDGETSHTFSETPWRGATFSTPTTTVATTPAGALRPSLDPSPFSADSVLQAISGGPSSGGPAAVTGGQISSAASAAPGPASRPVTPSNLLRVHTTPSQYFHQSQLISPSPLLSSTVTTVVADTILQHLEGGSPQASRRPSTRRVRAGLRSSLFVPQDELLLDDAERLLHPFAGYQTPTQRHYQQYQQQQQHRSTEALVAATPGTPNAAGDGHGAGSSSSSVRGRPRSLSAAFGGLFWPRRKSNANMGEGEGGGEGEGEGEEGGSAARTDYTPREDLLPSAMPPSQDRPGPDSSV